MIELLTSSVVTFKEGLEALLLIFAIMGSRKSDHIEKVFISVGIFIGVFVSFLLYFFVTDVVLLETPSIVISIATIIILLYLAFDSKNGSSSRTKKLLEMAHKSLTLLVLSIALIVIREGIEAVAAISTLTHSEPGDVLMGVGLGFTVLMIMSKMIFTLSSKVSKSALFKFCNYTFIAMSIYYLYELIFN